jgi:RNA polymerase sigma factor (sigma-70 family)
VPAEGPATAAPPATVSADDVHSWVNANLPRLQRYVDRELSYRESADLLPPNLVTDEEVIDEAIARALDDTVEKPDRLALEPWLYRLALRAIDELAARESEQVPTLTLEGRLRAPNSIGSDEAQLQYHQPDETITAENIIADRNAPTPEEAAYGDEMIRILQMTLEGAGRAEREAFILHTMEGFSVEEISSITDRKPDEVRALLARARDHVRNAAPLANRFRDRLLQASK